MYLEEKWIVEHVFRCCWRVLHYELLFLVFLCDPVKKFVCMNIFKNICLENVENI